MEIEDRGAVSVKVAIIGELSVCEGLRMMEAPSRWNFLVECVFVS